MNRVKTTFLMTILILCIGMAETREIRSLWALPWNLANAETIDQLVADAVNSHQTEILAEVRYRADALYMPNRMSTNYPNPEPRSSVIKSYDFDPLEYLLALAHTNGIEVQAWVTVFCATTTNTERLQENYLYRNHDDWVMTDETGRRMGLANQMGYFIDPGIPEVQSYLHNVIMDIVNGYPDLDGIHLDYIRYPEKKYGYHPVSVLRYEQANPEQELTWNEWRIAHVTGFVKKLNASIKTENPDMLLTAAVISYIDEARVHYAQDWVNWLNDGIVDRIYPMAYAKTANLFNRTATEIANKAPKDKVVMGLRAWQENGFPDYGVERIIEKAQFCRQLGFAGLALFSYEGVKKANMLPTLTRELYYWEDNTLEEPLDDGFITSLIPAVNTQSAANDTLIVLPEVVLSLPAQKKVDIIDEYYTSADSISVRAYCENITLEASRFLFSFFFEQETQWNWYILDIENNVVYQKWRTYPQGKQIEEWDGVSNTGNVMQPGVYTLVINDKQDVRVLQKRFIVY